MSNPSYLKNFPSNLDRDAIIEMVSDIATDPQINWQQITGEDVGCNIFARPPWISSRKFR